MTKKVRKTIMVSKEHYQATIDAFSAGLCDRYGIKCFCVSKGVLKSFAEEVLQFLGTVPAKLDDILIRSKDMQPIQRNAYTFGQKPLHNLTVAKPQLVQKTEKFSTYMVTPGTLREAVLLILRKSTDRLSSCQIHQATGRNAKTICSTLSALVEHGLAKRIKVPHPGPRQPRYLYEALN